MCLIILITRPSSRNFNALSFDFAHFHCWELYWYFATSKAVCTEWAKTVQIFRYTFTKLIALEESISYRRRIIIVGTHTHTTFRIKFGTSLPCVKQIAHTKMLKTLEYQFVKRFRCMFWWRIFLYIARILSFMHHRDSAIFKTISLFFLDKLLAQFSFFLFFSPR